MIVLISILLYFIIIEINTAAEQNFDFENQMKEVAAINEQDSSLDFEGQNEEGINEEDETEETTESNTSKDNIVFYS